jgi:hypothetical protein
VKATPPTFFALMGFMLELGEKKKEIVRVTPDENA